MLTDRQRAALLNLPTDEAATPAASPTTSSPSPPFWAFNSSPASGICHPSAFTFSIRQLAQKN
jgi:hypothetical protein